MTYINALFVNSEVMGKMSDLVSNLNESSAAVSLGNGVQGIIVRETEPEDVDEISFAYSSPVSELNVGALLLSDLHICYISTE